MFEELDNKNMEKIRKLIEELNEEYTEKVIELLLSVYSKERYENIIIGDLMLSFFEKHMKIIKKNLEPKYKLGLLNKEIIDFFDKFKSIKEKG
ncbi:MAG: hypothetical protein KKD44_27005 [Proteobacteria bacterium]|nr:hypothetical protein [Pseudomonadota bacterium]